MARPPYLRTGATAIGEPLITSDPTTSELEAAERRANELLCSWLSPAQREQWGSKESFTVIGSDSRKVYKLITSDIFNIVNDQGVFYCAVLPPRVAMFKDKDLIADRLLAQKIAIETDEKGFLAIANMRMPFPPTPGPQTFES